MKTKSVKASLTTMCLFIVVVCVAVIGAVSVFNIRSMSNMANSNYENAMSDGYNSEIKSEVQSVISILQSEYDRVQAGDLTEEAAKKEAAEIVRAMRYRDDGSGYFWIDDTDYNLIMHPILPDQEGNNRYDLTDQNGVKIIQEIMKVCTGADGGGYNEFYFTKSDGVTVAPKVAYSELFAPWGWVVSTGNYVDDMDATMAAAKTAIQQKESTMIISIVGIGLLMAVIAALVSIKFGNVICKPLVQIQGLAKRISDGNLTTSVDVREKNELGQTAGALNVAQQQIVGLISNIDSTASDLEHAVLEFSKNFNSMNESIQNVSTAIGEIAENTNSQAMSTNSASQSIEEMSNGIENTSKEVEALDENSQIMQDRSVKSMDTLKQLIEITTKTKSDIDSMYQQTQSNNDSVSKISSAATLIGEIASQTNLLALNASIEAARAGEAGRGFAVVAEEIGSLATQSDQTVQEINTIITELIKNSNQSVEIMQEMNTASETQVNALESTQTMFQELMEALHACMASIESISGKIQNMNAQREMITESITTLNQLATDNASSTEETSAMATELESVVSRSSQLIETLSQNIEALSENMKQFQF
jgi:methyl-accepting chemotaxis protein